MSLFILTADWVQVVVECLALAIAAGALWYTHKEYVSHSTKEDNKLFSQLNRRYEKNHNIQKVVRYLRDIDASDKEPSLYQLELFLRFFEELGLYMENDSIDTNRVKGFFGYYLRQLYKTDRGRALLLKLGLKEERKLKLLQEVKLKLGITMKQFNPLATRLIICFVDNKLNEYVEWEITDIPSANMLSETIGDSWNSNEEEYTPFEDGDTYRIVINVNQEKGEIVLFNDTENKEIEDFEIKEIFDEEVE